MTKTGEILEAIKQIAVEKGVDEENIHQGIKEGFKKAFERFVDTDANIDVDIDEVGGKVTIYVLKTIVQKVEDDWLEIGILEAKQKFGDNVAIGDVVREPFAYDREFGRLAILQFRQILQQKIRGAEKAMIYEKFVEKKHELLTGKIIGTNEAKNAYLVDVEGTTISLWKNRLMPGDVFEINDFVTFYVEDVDRDNKVSQIMISRTSPGYLQKILERDIPEVAEGIIQICRVSREPGQRAKVAVRSFDENVEPIGSIVGVHGNRINKISEQLHGEKIDIVNWSEDVNTFIMNAMAPVRVVSVDFDEENQEADVIVPNEQLSLAIGRLGIAARLVANLLKLKINILSVDQAKEYWIDNKWNGNISEEELNSKEFIESAKRRVNNREKPKQSFRRDNAQPREREFNRTPRSENNAPNPYSNENFEDELKRFQQQLKEEDQQEEEVFVVVDDFEPKLQEKVKTLEEIAENLKNFEEVLEKDHHNNDYDDENYDEDDEEYDDEYDSYYDK